MDCNQDKFGNDVQPDEDHAPKMEQDKVSKCNEEVSDEEVIGPHDNQDDELEEVKEDTGMNARNRCGKF